MRALSDNGQEEECACCHELEQVCNKSQEVNEKIKPALPFTCITDNPGFHTVCLDIWVLQAAWFGYKQQYGSRAYKVPEHNVNRHIAYHQLVRWCWGVTGKEIRVVLPTCAVFGHTFHLMAKVKEHKRDLSL